VKALLYIVTVWAIALVVSWAVYAVLRDTPRLAMVLCMALAFVGGGYIGVKLIDRYAPKFNPFSPGNDQTSPGP